MVASREASRDDLEDYDLGDVYELLGVEESASEKDIQTAFRKGSLRVHPDRNPNDPEAADKFARLTRAKDFLLNPAKRAEYDNKRNAERKLQQREARRATISTSEERRRQQQFRAKIHKQATVQSVYANAFPHPSAMYAHQDMCFDGDAYQDVWFDDMDAQQDIWFDESANKAVFSDGSQELTSTGPPTDVGGFAKFEWYYEELDFTLSWQSDIPIMTFSPKKADRPGRCN
jgi:curved DNA-binding protein CbpA